MMALEGREMDRKKEKAACSGRKGSPVANAIVLKANDIQRCALLLSSLIAKLFESPTSQQPDIAEGVAALGGIHVI
jgi:hypothetical protein